jgi:MFS family permease
VHFLIEKICSHPTYSHERSLKAALLDAAYFCMMVGFGETFLSSFAIALGGTAFQVGMMSAIPPLVAALSQTLGLNLFRRGVPRKKIIATGVFIQGISWFCIAALALLVSHANSWTIWILLLLWSIYLGSGNTTAPAWNSLIGDLVPPTIRGSYFGFRTQRSGWITVGSMLIGGLVLSYARSSGYELPGFALLFSLAGVARLISGYWLAQYDEPGYSITKNEQFSFFDFLRKTRSSNFAKFVFFLGLMNGAASFSGSYFSLYILRDLKLSYIAFSGLVTIQLITQYLFMTQWGKLSDEFGNKKILEVCALGICFSSIIWLVSDNYIYMCFGQIYGGLFWAGFNLAAGNFLFDAVTPPKRAQCATYTTLINSSFVALGSYLGGFIVTYAPSDFLINQGLFTGTSIYFKIFTISLVLRLTIYFLMLPKFTEVRSVSPSRHRDIFYRITGIHSVAEASFEWINASRSRKDR